LYDDFSLLLNPKTNILVGNNAQGKTSVIEAIHVLGITKSHKTNKDKDMIKNQQEYAKISSLVHLNNKDIELDIILSKLGKKAKYNQIELERLSDYIGQLNVVLFAPEDLDLIKGNPQTRRKFLDLEIGQISKDYLFTNQTYKKILKERNDLLKSMQKKNKPDLMLLDIITEQLVTQLENIVRKRTSFIAQINDFARKIYKQISQSNKELKIEYLPSLTCNFKEEFDKKYQYDIITGTTNLGAHRDDIEFYLDEFPIKTHGSQGELRTAVLSTKLALIEFIYTHKKEYPVLLLDDVLSELDAERQNNLIKYINNKVQTIITTTDISDINLSKIDNYTVFEVNKGRIEESDKYGKHI
jgi:DNA replication and repair protein RecF